LEGALAGKCIIVTGAGGGIGRDSAVVFAKAGGRLVLSDVAQESGRQSLIAVQAVGGTAVFVPADLASESDIVHLIDTAVQTYGRLDGAFNNAGVEHTGKAIEQLSASEWNRAILIDLTSVFLSIKYQAIAMLKTGGGAIVNTASGCGQVAIRDAAEYVAAKHGVVGLTRAAAADLSPRGIRVNAVLPGAIETPMMSRVHEGPQYAALVKKMDSVRERHPIGRFGRPAEVGEAAKWLMSDAASFVTGATLAVDGGYLAV
jgi:NAD(P)-dependent dehydrogenase (short-subunit alcohol dehydrogenase family)